MFGKLEAGERQSAGAAVEFDNRLNEQLRVVFKDFSPQALSRSLGRIGMK
jgi:hypothetical protein